MHPALEAAVIKGRGPPSLVVPADRPLRSPHEPPAPRLSLRITLLRIFPDEETGRHHGHTGALVCVTRQARAGVGATRNSFMQYGDEAGMKR